MSWLDSIKSEVIIITGDGKQYRPLWVPTGLSREYNVTEFDFPEIEGTYVPRKKARGRRFDAYFIFQGDDHLDTWKAFDQSAKDERPWIISHPYYDQIFVQPVALSYDHSNYNTTEIKGLLIETILDDKPKASVSPLDKINIDKQNVDAALLDSFDVQLNANDANNLKKTNNALYQKGKVLGKTQEQSEDYFNAFNRANSTINRSTADPIQAMRTIQTMINAPALFTGSVKSRIATLSDLFFSVSNGIERAVRRQDKKIYETNATGLVSSVAIAAVNPTTGDYTKRAEVLDVMEQVLYVYTQYLKKLDIIQTPTGSEPNSFIPDANALTALSDLINFTVSSLFSIVMSSKQERSIILQEDSNPILLVHRYIGLDADDKNLEEFIDINNIGINELYQLRKGRKIIYYV